MTPKRADGRPAGADSEPARDPLKIRLLVVIEAALHRARFNTTSAEQRGFQDRFDQQDSDANHCRSRSSSGSDPQRQVNRRQGQGGPLRLLPGGQVPPAPKRSRRSRRGDLSAHLSEQVRVLPVNALRHGLQRTNPER